MAVGQALPLDMLMYYDARPCGMNGLFKHETYEPLKGYYSFVAFDTLARLGTSVKTEYEKDGIYSCAATNGTDSAVVLTYYDEDDESENKMVELEIAGNSGKTVAEAYLLDENNDLTLVSKQYFTSEKFALIFDMKIHTSVLVKLVKA